MGDIKAKISKIGSKKNMARILSFVFLSIISLFVVSSFFNISNAQGTTEFVGPINTTQVGFSACSINPNIAGGITLKYIIMNLIIGCILTRTAYLIIMAAVVVFLYGVFKFMRAEGEDKQKGREFIFWGIIGIFVMISLWGLVAILQNTFNFGK
jgi:hypothetical protein